MNNRFSESGREVRISWRSSAWKIVPQRAQSELACANRSACLPTSSLGRRPRWSLPPVSFRRAHSRGFTLIELLVVIAIIGILASILVPSLAAAKKKAQVSRARTDILALKTAISSYYAAYSRYPIGKDTMGEAAGRDYTFGTRNKNGVWAMDKKKQVVRISTPNLNERVQQDNHEVVGILSDSLKFPDNTPNQANLNHSRNPNKTSFLAAKFVKDFEPNGVGLDGTMRDPWGMPYIISFDLDGNDQTLDAVYGQRLVSDPKNTGQALNGLVKTERGYEAREPFMIWSLGPDQHADATVAGDQGVNKDNVLSWK